MPYERIPEELRAVRQWHCWSLRDDVKVPIQVTGENAKSNKPETWSDFETAADASVFYNGLAFEITDPWTGIDLDDCIDENGLKAWALEILFRFDGVGFAEVSPSGTGIKIITRGRKPAGSRCTHRHSEGQIECYDNRRFWTITGDTYNGQDEIKDGQQAVDWLCGKYLSGAKQEPVKQIPQVTRTIDTPLLKRAETYLQSVPGETKGNLRNAAFSLSGHLHSMVDDSGGRLSDDEVLSLLHEWNRKNTPPLKDHELKEASVNGRKNGTPRPDKVPQVVVREYPQVDLSKILGEERGDDFDDEEFCKSIVPERGLITEIFAYYCEIAHRRSFVMGMATAVSLCQMLFGRRITSHTDLRTNDYNVIMAPTSSGKEACETTITKILQSSVASLEKLPIVASDVQSGNGLVKAIVEQPCSIWICDEFGKTLEAVLDKKSNNGHAKLIGTHLLKLYTKSAGVYSGAAHAAGKKNQVNQPHLCLLGLTTGQIFNSIDSGQIQDGLFGRLAFWPVQNRPRRRSIRSKSVPEKLSDMVRFWLAWEPLCAMAGSPRPVVIEFSEESLKRWEHHADAIDAKMESENELRAAIWGRVAARAMKLSLVHRASRISEAPETLDWQTVMVEMEDIDWGIKVANWLGRVACGLVRENVVDKQAARAKQVILKAVGELGSVSRSDLLREFRSISASEFNAAANDLKESGEIEVVDERTSGRTKVLYRLKTTVQTEQTDQE